MKIGIDTFGCEHGKSGIGSYLLSLVKNITLNTTDEFELFGEEIDRYQFNSDSPGITFSAISIRQSTSIAVWHKTLLAQFAKKQKYDAILFPAFLDLCPVVKNIPSYAVIISVPEKITFLQKIAFKKATKIIVATEFIKKKLVKRGIDKSKIVIIHNGIDNSLFYQRTELPGQSSILNIKPFAIKRPYFIYASKIQKKSKKHQELIEAFDLFKKKTGLPHRLVLAGDISEKNNDIQSLITKSEFASDIFLTGYFPHESMPDLYSYADACIFPAVSEGVGLPVLEAMACGIPVACANSGALKEIAGQNAIFFNPDNIQDIANAMEIIVKDEKIRKDLIQSSFNWIKLFSWKKTAEKTIELIKN